MRKLTAADPSNAVLLRDLTVILNKVGDLALAQKDLPTARSQYEASLAIVEKLAAADATNLALQGDLAATLDRLANALLAQGDFADVGKPLDEVLAVRRKLAAGAPSPAADRDLAVALNRCGDVRTALKDNDGAIKLYQEALAIVRRLAAADPSNAGLQRDIAVSLWKLAGVSGSPVHWADVAGQLDGMRQKGQLAASDNANLAEAQKRAAAEVGK